MRSLGIDSYLILYMPIQQDLEILRVVSGYQDLPELFKDIWILVTLCWIFTLRSSGYLVGIRLPPVRVANVLMSWFRHSIDLVDSGYSIISLPYAIEWGVRSTKSSNFRQLDRVLYRNHEHFSIVICLGLLRRSMQCVNLEYQSEFAETLEDRKSVV